METGEEAKYPGPARKGMPMLGSVFFRFGDYLQACAEKDPVLPSTSQAQTGRTFSQLSNPSFSQPGISGFRNRGTITYTNLTKHIDKTSKSSDATCLAGLQRARDAIVEIW